MKGEKGSVLVSGRYLHSSVRAGNREGENTLCWKGERILTTWRAHMLSKVSGAVVLKERAKERQSEWPKICCVSVQLRMESGRPAL